MQLVPIAVLVVVVVATATTAAAADLGEAQHSARTVTSVELEELGDDLRAELARAKATIAAQRTTITQLTARVAALSRTQTTPHGQDAGLQGGARPDASAAAPLASGPRVQSRAPGDEPPPTAPYPTPEQDRTESESEPESESESESQSESESDAGYLAPSRRLPAYPAPYDETGNLVVGGLPLDGYVRL